MNIIKFTKEFPNKARCRLHSKEQRESEVGDLPKMSRYQEMVAQEQRAREVTGCGFRTTLEAELECKALSYLSTHGTKLWLWPLCLFQRRVY
jgi:hypothetical protein